MLLGLKNQILVILIFFVCYFNNELEAQIPNLNFRHLTNINGLSNNMVSGITQDQNGFIWIATHNGLNRYDGKTFQRYNLSDSASIPYDYIITLHLDIRNRLWIISDVGIIALDCDSEQIIYRDSHDYFPWVYAVSEKSDGNLLLGTSIGILEININELSIRPVIAFNKDSQPYLIGENKNGQYAPDSSNYIADFYSFIFDQFGDKEFNVFTICVQRNGDVWFDLSKKILFKWDTDEAKITKCNEKYSKNAFSSLDNIELIYEDINGILWFGEHSGKLYSYNGNELKHRYTLKNPSTAEFTYFEAEEDSLHIWFGTGYGLLMWNKKHKNFLLNTHSSSNSLSIGHNRTAKLHLDHQANLWIGFDVGNAGLDYVNLSSSIHFNHIRIYPYEEDALSSNTITALYESEDNGIWIGTNKGLNNYNLISQTYSHYLKDYTICNVIESSKGDVWLLARKIGEVELNLWGRLNGENIFKKYSHVKVDYEGLSVKGSFALIESSKGDIVIGTKNLVFYYPERNKYETFYYIGFDEFCNDILESNNGYLFIAQATGLVVMNPNYSNLENSTVVELTNNIINDDVWKIASDQQNNLWVATTRGISKIESAMNHDFDYFLKSVAQNNYLHVENFTMKQGLAGYQVYNIINDSDNNLWFSTEFGLSLFNTRYNRFHNFTLYDGLTENSVGYTFDKVAYTPSMITKSGNIYLGSANGICFFNPREIYINNNKPNVIITEFKIGNQTVIPKQVYNDQVILTEPISKTRHLSLSYKNRLISFSFIALDYCDPQKNKYAYILDGLDDQFNDWTEVGSDNRTVTYSNLPGGNYTFKVKASNNEGIWNDEGTALNITIAPPFWKTLWFRIVTTATIMIIFAGVFYLRIHALKKNKEELENMVKDRTQELEVSNISLKERQQKIALQAKQLRHKNLELIKQRDSLQIMQAEVEKANQEKLRFFTNISHEIRTPLTLITGPINRLINSSFNKNIFAEQLQIIHRNSQQLLRLINQLLDFRQVETGHGVLNASEGDIVLFLEDIFNSFKLYADQKSIKYNFRFSNQSIITWFDKEKMEKILCNLISNALKYNNKEGEVNVVISQIDLSSNKEDVTKFNYHDEKITFKEYIRIEISDTGFGIRSSKLPYIFDRFYKANNDQYETIQGTGIGLALVKQYTEMHKGIITVESTENIGSKFILLIPLGKDHLEPDEISDVNTEFTFNSLSQVGFHENTSFDINIDELNQHHTIDTPEILVVEDHPEVLKYIIDTLSVEYKVQIAKDGKEGLMKTETVMPDLIVSDVMMPKMNGIDMCEQLKSSINTCHIPVILLTAKSEMESKIEGLDSGADDYIIKPFNTNELLARTKNLITLRQKLRDKFKQDTDLSPIDYTANNTDEKFFERILKIIDHNIGEEQFDLINHISELGIGRTSFYAKLKSITGYSPNEFVKIIRLKKASKLLQSSTNIHISEVAYLVGFSDPSYFGRVFKRHFGVAPKDYKTKITTNNFNTFNKENKLIDPRQDQSNL